MWLTDNLLNDDISSATVAFESHRSSDTLKGSLVKRTYEQVLPDLVPTKENTFFDLTPVQLRRKALGLNAPKD